MSHIDTYKEVLEYLKESQDLVIREINAIDTKTASLRLQLEDLNAQWLHGIERSDAFGALIREVERIIPDVD